MCLNTQRLLELGKKVNPLFVLSASHNMVGEDRGHHRCFGRRHHVVCEVCRFVRRVSKRVCLERLNVGCGALTKCEDSNCQPTLEPGMCGIQSRWLEEGTMTMTGGVSEWKQHNVCLEAGNGRGSEVEVEVVVVVKVAQWDEICSFFVLLCVNGLTICWYCPLL
ncbi:hypothetical protein BDD12DRAFT_99935 [Trichophaea hybrida]|nr:hypothetical protein BDD12DRAFT_99935 [Trichophaea hybrida]